MADYNAEIKISADAREAEKTVKDLNEQIKKLGDVAKKSVGSALNFGSGGLQSTLNDVAGGFTGLRNQLEGGAIRGGLTATALAAGKAAPAFKVVGGAVNNLRDSLTGLVKQTAELGVKAGLPLTGALLGASTALNGASQSLTTTSNLFNSFLSLIGNIPSSVGLAAVAIMAMGPAILSAGSAVTATVPVVGALGRALDNLAGGKVQKAVGALGLKINETKQSFFGLNTEIKTTVEGINALAEGLSLTQLNKQVSDTRSQMEGFHSSTVHAWHAAQQLVQVQRAQVAEQAALNDLVRKAAGLRPQSVENRATNTYNTTQRRKAYESEQLNKFNNEIDEYNRLAVEAAANTKAWEDRLASITRVAGAGPLGTKSQLSTRVQEFLANKQSAQIARENSAAVLGREKMLAGGQYGLDVLPAGKTLSPGGNTLAAQKQYRDLLNELPGIQNAIAVAAERTGRSQRQLEIAAIGTAKSTAQRVQISTTQNKIDEQSVAIARARNLELAKELGIEVDIGNAAANNNNKARGSKRGGAAKNAVGNAIIGGAFPLLFGQGAAAAVGGGLGGAAGGLLGGTFGFGLSLVGTAIGDAVTKAEEFDKALTKVNVSAKGVGNTAQDVDKLASSLGIAKDEAIKLLAEFSAFESASSRALLASTFGEGDFKAAFDALEKATKEQAVLDAIVASRKILGNVKTGELITQLQLNGGAKAELVLQEALIRAKEKQVIEDKKRVTLQDLLLAGLATAGGGESVDPTIFGKQRAADQQKQDDKTRADRKKQIAEEINNAQKLFAEIDKLSQQYTDADSKRKKKSNNDVATEQARQAEQLARNQIELDNAVFRNKMRLADEEFALRQRIASLQGKFAEAQAFGAQREIIAFVNEFGNIQANYASETRRLTNDVAIAAQELKAATAMIGAQQAGVVGGRYVQGGIGPKGANQYGPHFDIKRSDGGFYSRTALDRYVQVNGRPLSSGVTVPGGEFGAPRSYGGHAGRDYAFASGAAMSLTGGAKWMESQAGSYGDAAAFMTPDGQVYKVIHGKFEATGTTAKGQYQVVGAQGDEKVQQENLNAAIETRTKLIALLQQERQLKLQIAVAGATEFLRTAQEQTMQLENEIQKRKIRNRLALEGVAPEIIDAEMRVFDILKERDNKLKELNVQLSKLTKVQNLNTISTVEATIADYDKKLATTGLTEAEKAIVAELEKKLFLLQGIKAIEEGTPTAVQGAVSAGQAAIQTPQEKIEERVGALKKELAELTNLGNIAITVADGIGNAFGNAFKGLIDGSMTAREALSSFFKDVASMFLEMAAQIIAKQMTMIILQTILKALGAVAGASGGGGFGAGGNSFNANGALPAGTGNIPSLGSSYGFAKGGVFNSPKFFKFAEGGTMQNGVLGEAGPEAIMPLSRGAGGKLGVNASGLREAMGGAPGMGGSPVLSMSFETTRFGDTDYVSRDQLEAAMVQTRKQASADGAKRGMSMTLDRLQQSPQTRSRVGLR